MGSPWAGERRELSKDVLPTEGRPARVTVNSSSGVFLDFAVAHLER